MMASREELEHAYSPSRWSHRMGSDDVINAHIKTLTEGSNLARECVDCEVGFSFGLSEKEKFDVFGAKTLPGDAPIFVYIHGGYWSALGREMSSFMAPVLCKAGAVVVSVGYDLAPQANMDEIVSQVKKAVSFVLTMATRRGSSGVYLCGHSAGAHLAALMLSQNWLEETMVSPGMIKGAVLVCGVYDLRPLVNTYVNDPLKMTVEDAVRNSPVTHLDKIAGFSEKRRFIVAYGDHDPPEFQRQSTEFNIALSSRGIQSTLMVIPDTDHFNVIENLQLEDYSLSQEIVKLMNLNIGPILDQMQSTNIS
ncbi:kynurenine formamidase-like [Mercenaria mercenaria]|uniref:kynurenine formamidase-like n=1 Tax=Mercenaria mercenaria TaxID=6596 RepID=UPI00234F920B|nr:kynurenine formamidase-like [Mercenaria mercenaria]XP_053396079.1 kynurenine formamidase-like [Mercenaria mercenaria]